jgi:pimeloyl-ACP methyl ester carboxylesterase
MSEVRSEDGTVIAFDRTGEGPPVILVSGALSDRSTMPPITALLAPHLTVFAYDRRGRGDSGDTLPYAVEREVEDLDALFEEAGGSAFVFGHSSGAALALEAARQKLPIAKLALYEPPFIVDDSRPPVPEDYADDLKELLAEHRRGDALTYFLTVGVGMPLEAVESMHGSPMWAGMEAIAHTLTYDGAIMGDRMSGKPLPAEWGSMEVPTLVMDGGASDAWARNSVGALVDLLPNAQRRTLEGQTHGADPAVLAPVLLAFFA